MATGTMKNPNPTEKTGSFVANTGVTVYEFRAKQTGKVVEVHMYATLNNISVNPYRIGRITDVDFPPAILRMLVGAGTVTYQAIRTAYLAYTPEGAIDIYRSQTSDSVINIDFMYTVD